MANAIGIGLAINFLRSSKTYPLTDAFVQATGLVNTSAIDGLRLLESGIKNSGIISSLRMLHPLVADADSNAGRLSQMAVNFLDPNTFLIQWFASPTAVSVDVADSGVDFNGTTQYGDTGFNPLTEYGTDVLSSLGFYSGEDTVTASAFQTDMGVVNTVVNILIAKRTGATFNHFSIGNTNASIIATRSGVGFFGGTRRTSSFIKSWRNKVSAYENSSDTFVAHPDGAMYIGARREVSAAFQFTNRRLQLVFAGNDLSDELWESFVDVNTEYQTALNRFVG